MDTTSKGRSGNKDRGLTRNQKRKAAYAEKAKAEQHNRQHGKRAATGSAAQPLGLRVHGEPCGNPACTKCFVRTGQGIYPRRGQPVFPGRVIGMERFRNEEAAQAAGANWNG